MKQYNEKKICFIIYADNKQYLEECILYLSVLDIPEGYETELLVVEDSISMAMGYNEAMNASDAKYKIYLRQEAFVIERQLVQKVLDIFNTDNKIGMIGALGCINLSKDALVHHSEVCGALCGAKNYKNGIEIIPVESAIQEVEIVDDLFMATQYDIIWREDLLDGQEFCKNFCQLQCLQTKHQKTK